MERFTQLCKLQRIDSEIEYVYYSQGGLDKVKTITPNSSETLEADYGYNTADQITNMQPGNLQPVTYTYNTNRGWLESVTDSGDAFSENLTYYNNGNIDEQTINNNTVGSNYTYTFLYDDKNRLTDAVTTLTGASESYSYNLDGAIQSKNRDGNNLEYKYWSGNNRLQKVIKNGTDTTNYAYDTKGNIYGGYGVLKEYNYQNLPTEMFNKDSTVYKYSYNSNGKRIKKTNAADNSGEYYLRDYIGRELVIYDNETGDPKIANVFGNGLVGRIEINGTTDERFYYLKDHLGSIRATLNEYGTVVSAQDYFPYGETIRNYVYGMPIEKYKYVGKERDVESGYDNFGWRTFDSKLPMWLQVDPLSDKYPGWSPYNYALNNPTNFVDMKGDSVSNIDQKQLEEMMKNMNVKDSEQYQKYVDSESMYNFSDLYYGWNIITEARKYIGLEYKIGEENLSKCADCSGYVWAVLKEFGYIGERFYTWNISESQNAQYFRSINEPIWGDILLGGGHMGFYDPTPIAKAPGKGGEYHGTYLSARTSYGSVHYGKQSWYTVNQYLRIK